jgi:hypothetical protein
MKNIVIVLAIVLQQACTASQSDMADSSTMIDSSTAIKWDCVTTASSHAPIKFTAVYDAASGIGYLESGGKKLYTKSNFFANSSKWSPPDVFVLVRNRRVMFYESGRKTRHIPARCLEL